MMNAAFGSWVSFGSGVRSNIIGNNTYTSIRRNFRSKPKYMHGKVHKYELNFS